MRRRAAWIIILSIVGLALVPAVLGQPLQQQVLVQITSPRGGEQVRGVVPILGSASVPSFQFYKVEFGFGPNPTSWSVIGELHKQPVVNSQLEIWNTSGLPDGVYTLRVQGVKLDGNWEEYFVRDVQIANALPAATPTPAETPTPSATELASRATLPPTQRTAVATATPRATATATVAAVMGSPTPTLSGPVQRESPFDVPSLRDALLYGGIAMGAVFVMLGIVFGLRRLL